MRKAKWVLVAMAGLALGCGPGLGEPAVGEVRTGAPHAARARSCSLQFVSVSAGDMAPGAQFGSGGKYETVGSVMIGAKEDADPMSEEIKALVRPRACQMGGEVVSLLAAGTSQGRRQFVAQSNIVFMVWGPITKSGPQAF